MPVFNTKILYIAYAEDGYKRYIMFDKLRFVRHGNIVRMPCIYDIDKPAYIEFDTDVDKIWDDTIVNGHFNLIVGDKMINCRFKFKANGEPLNLHEEDSDDEDEEQCDCGECECCRECNASNLWETYVPMWK